MENNSANDKTPTKPQPENQPTEPTNPPTQPQAQPAKPKNPVWKKILMIIGGFVVGVIALAAIIITIVSISSKKLECTSSQGSITIMYGDDTINGYAANGISYDFDTQKTYAGRIGVEAYLEEFTDFFESSTDGTCVKK